MSSWQVGARYTTRWGSTVECSRRWFDGATEYVQLSTVPLREGTARAIVWGTARGMAQDVVPPVTETLGGVYRGDACVHLAAYGRVVANAGPHIGGTCCAACGTPPGVPP